MKKLVNPELEDDFYPTLIHRLMAFEEFKHHEVIEYWYCHELEKLYTMDEIFELNIPYMEYTWSKWRISQTLERVAIYTK